jgi:hypothetical protein
MAVTSDRIWADRIYTQRSEKSVGGMLLCGINPGDGGGGEAIAYAEDAPKSFFSDPTCQNASFPYQRRIREWFALWGHALRTTRPGDLELAISQTNWFAQSTQFAGGLYGREALVACAAEEFLPVLEIVKPRLLVFFGVQHLPGAFADERLRSRLEALFGTVTKPLSEPIWFTRSRGGRRFRAMTMEFKNLQVVGLPHPTPRSGALAMEDARKLGGVFSAALKASRIVGQDSSSGAE